MNTEEILKLLAENNCNVRMDGNNIVIEPIEPKSECIDGEICTTNSGIIFISNGEIYDNGRVGVYCGFDKDNKFSCALYVETSVCVSDGYRFATDEEKEKLFDAIAKEGKQWNAEKKCIEPYQPKDKELVWCWSNMYITKRVIGFYDMKNKCTFSYNGKRKGNSYRHYAPFGYPIPDWAMEALKHLED